MKTILPIFVSIISTLTGSVYAMAEQIGSHEPVSAIAVLHPTQGHAVEGTVWFEPVKEHVRITVDIDGLAPNSVHGFHIHEFGDCSASDASSAGGHYSPSLNRHGGPKEPFHHAGDLGNIKADKNGRVHTSMRVDFITVNGVNNPIVGRAVVLHAKADDFVSQPSGSAGARLACGVIGIANPNTRKDIPDE